MDLIERLDRHFADQASPGRSPDIGAVLERGEQLRSRQRTMAVAVPAAAILLVGIGIAAVLQREAPQTDIADVVADQGVLELAASELEWAASPATLGWSIDHTSDGELLYALSTAPGTRFEDFPDGRVPQAIYTSADGSDWQVQGVGDLRIGDIAAGDGLLYTIGTAPGSHAGSVTLELGVSHDGGATIETSTLSDDESHAVLIAPKVAVTDDGVLALATSVGQHPGEIPAAAMDQVPPDLLEDGNAVITTPNGVAVVPPEVAAEVESVCASAAPEECQTLVDAQSLFFASWERLAVPAPADPSADAQTTVAYWSTDGVSFEPIEVPFGSGQVESVYQVGDDLVVASFTEAGIELFRYAGDGSWQQVPAPRLIATFDAGRVGDSVVVVGLSQEVGGLAVYRADRLDGPWSEVPLEEIVPFGQGPGASRLGVSDAAVGAEGVAISLVQETVGGSENPLTGLLRNLFPGRAPEEDPSTAIVNAVLHSADLETWSMSATSEQAPVGGIIDTLLYAPGGNLLGHVSHVENGQLVRQQLTAAP